MKAKLHSDGNEAIDSYQLVIKPRAFRVVVMLRACFETIEMLRYIFFFFSLVKIKMCVNCCLVLVFFNISYQHNNSQKLSFNIHAF